MTEGGWVLLTCNILLLNVDWVLLFLAASPWGMGSPLGRKDRAPSQRVSEDAEPGEISVILGEAWKTKQRRHPAIRKPAVPTENGKPLKSLGRKQLCQASEEMESKSFFIGHPHSFFQNKS